MAIYAIGDIQGCYDHLQRLLEGIDFNPSKDKLWFAGDLVNRGPDSLQTLRFIKSLGDRAVCVLGNHDLSLLALAYGNKRLKHHTLDDVLNAPDREELLFWLRHQKLLHHDKKRAYTLVHAGIYPNWDLKQASNLAKEVETILKSDNYIDFLFNMYGNLPDQWNDNLVGWERLRFITNTFTRMRYCYPDLRLNFSHNNKPGTQPNELIPWYEIKNRKISNNDIIFGHWSTLFGNTSKDDVYALDTGCLWGGQLTAMKLLKKKSKLRNKLHHFIKINC